MVKTFKYLLQNQSPMILKLGMQQWGLKLYKVYRNDDPGLTLICFMARSMVAYVFEWGKLTKSFNGENLKQMTQLTEDCVYEKFRTRRLACLCSGVIYFLKQLGQSKPSFTSSFHGNGERKVIEMVSVT